VLVTKLHNKTPYELVSGKVPNIIHLKFMVWVMSGTQDDSDSECDEQVIVVPSFPSNSFSGHKIDEASDMVESSLDYAEELARLQKQAYEANATVEKHMGQADLAASRNRVPAGQIDSAAGVS
ncbi:hypothetical protein Tco_0358353, partial [Tanacetum coccineum]